MKYKILVTLNRTVFSAKLKISLVWMLAALLMTPVSVQAQQVVANGISVEVPGGTFDTTPSAATPAFLAQNGGTIVATAPVYLIQAAEHPTAPRLKAADRLPLRADRR